MDEDVGFELVEGTNDEGTLSGTSVSLVLRSKCGRLFEACEEYPDAGVRVEFIAVCELVVE